MADSEAVIIGFQEQMQNDNPPYVAETGRLKRSNAQAGTLPSGCLGAFLVRDLKSGVEFTVGGGKGITAGFLQVVWNSQSDFIGRIIRYQYLATGTKPGGKPRMPKFNGFRPAEDL